MKKSLRSIFLIVVLGIFASCLSVNAQERGLMPSEIEVCIEGEVCFDAYTFSFEASQSGSMHIGGGGGAGKVNIEDVVLFRHPDLSSIELMRVCAKGGHLDSVEISLRKTTHDGYIDDFMKFNLSPVMITSYKLKADKDNSPCEEIKLNFAQMEISAEGDRGEVKMNWNIEKNIEE